MDGLADRLGIGCRNQSVLMEDLVRAIEQLADFDTGFGITAAERSGGDVDDLCMQPEAVIISDHSGVTPADDALKLCGRWSFSPGGGAVEGRTCEVAVVV